MAHLRYDRTLAELGKRPGEERHALNMPGRDRRGQSPTKYGREVGQDGAFLLVGKDLLSHVVDHYRTFEVGYGWISAVLLSDE